MKLKELLSQMPCTCYLEIHCYDYGNARELMGWSNEMEKELKELGDYEIGYFEPINGPHAGLKISIHQLESSFDISTGGETVKLEPGVGIGIDPKYPFQSPEKVKTVNITTPPDTADAQDEFDVCPCCGAKHFQVISPPVCRGVYNNGHWEFADSTSLRVVCLECGAIYNI